METPLPLNTASGQDVLDAMIVRINGMTPEQRAEFEEKVLAGTAGMKFIPNAGPQLEAWNCTADILLYGGQAGGGKSALILGLALSQHRRSLIMRRHYSDLTALTEKVITLNGTRQGYNGSIPPTLRTADDRLLEFGAAQHPGDEFKWMGRDHDLLGLDEAWQFTKNQVRALIGWVRTDNPTQRCRIILATNPPLSAEGEWLLDMFGPWLDTSHPNPAKEGELRWFVTVQEEGDKEGRDIEVDGPTQTEHKDEKGRALRPLSRTFIRSSVEDNPFYARTDYAAKLDSLQGAVRSSARDGNFMSVRNDDDWQVIPTAWVRAAQERWTPYAPEGVPMCVISCDPTGGGQNDNAIAKRYDGWYDKLVLIPGKQTPYGEGIGGAIITNRRDHAEVVIDMDGGYGNKPYGELKDNIEETSGDGVSRKKLHAYKGSEASTARSSDRLYGFVNKRSQTHWQFREALDPNQPGGSVVSLPPDQKLLADLTAPRYSLVSHKGLTCVKVESKDDIKERLDRSPDRGDAVMNGWAYGPKAASHGRAWNDSIRRGGSPKVIRGHQNRKGG